MLTNIKKRSALLVSLAVICASVALVPQTASAQSKLPNLGTTASAHTAANNTTVMTSCPGNSAPAAGFTDTTSTDVDCIKMFGITQGTTATTYEPDASIPRWQMALFLHRMFVPVGLAAAGTTTVPAFTDTAGLSTEITDAITAIASHGITVGTSATTFSPNDNVSREQMALFLYRMGQLVAPFNSATVTTKGIFADNSADIATGTYNYTDITGATFEGMEAIIAMYNLGGTGEAATCVTGNLCSASYRPSADMTRAEMATMVKSVLDHSQARPAGCTIQNDEALVSGNNEGTMISCRNADFTAQANTIVDEFYQVRNDTTAATAALSVPFLALSNLVDTTAGTGVAGASTAGTMDSGDRVTNVRGNVDGADCAAAAAATCRHWVWTGDQGSVYVDGTTTVFLWEEGLPASATPATYATTMTTAIGDASLRLTCDMSSQATVTANDGECAIAGETVTITTTLTGAAATAVVDGYTVKYVDKVSNYGGGTGNESVVYETHYAASSAGVATVEISCSADHSALANVGGVADDGANDNADYWESHEITVSNGTAAGGTGIPGGSISTNTGNADIGCDDVARGYTDGNHTMTVGKNWYNVSTAGSLGSVTATAYDQYGDTLPGVSVTFDTDTEKNVAETALASADATRVTLLTGSNGSATYTLVVCDAASVGVSGTVGFRIDDAGGSPEMSDTGSTDAGAAAEEGDRIYCVTNGTDTQLADTLNTNIADQASNDEIQKVAFTATSGGGASDPDEIGKYTLTMPNCGATSTTIQLDGDDADTVIKGAIETLSCITAVAITLTGGGTTYTHYTIGMLANSGNWDQMTVTEATGNDALVLEGQNADGTALDVTASTTQDGLYGTTFTFVDHDSADSSFITKRVAMTRTAAGAAVVETSYNRWTYDDTDAYNIVDSNNSSAGTALADTPGATKAQMEAAMNLVSDLTTTMDVINRTGATSTGVSAIAIGN
jgi:hypothetical protein